MMTEQQNVTLIQDAAGQVIRVRIGNTEIPVMHAGPVVGPGQMNLSLTIPNVSLNYEADTEKK